MSTLKIILHFGYVSWASNLIYFTSLGNFLTDWVFVSILVYSSFMWWESVYTDLLHSLINSIHPKQSTHLFLFQNWRHCYWRLSITFLLCFDVQLWRDTPIITDAFFDKDLLYLFITQSSCFYLIVHLSYFVYRYAVILLVLGFFNQGVEINPRDFKPNCTCHPLSSPVNCCTKGLFLPPPRLKNVHQGSFEV